MKPKTVQNQAAMIDKQTLLERADLLGLAEHDSQLRHVASTGGGEWAGPCPFCGGVDRFRVQPDHSPWGLWMCRQCTGGKWQNAIDYIMRRDSCDFKQACETLGGGDPPRTRRRRPAPQIPAYDPPAGEWQVQALRAIEICQRNLWDDSGAAALAYLKGRGLRDEILRYFEIGFSPGARFGHLFVPRGILIPCRAGGEIWYLKIALLPGDPVKCEKCGKPAKARQACPSCGAANKYRGVKDNRTGAIYNAGDLVGAELALFVEGEFDCMIAWQELDDVVAVATLGAANNRPDLATWGAYLLNLQSILTAYDSDHAGEQGVAFLAEFGARACPLPEGVKDINDLYLAGGDLWGWLKANLERLGVLAELGALA